MLIIQKDWKNKTCTINKFKFPALTQRLPPLQLPVGFFKLFWAQLTPGGLLFTQMRPQDTYALNLAFYLTMHLKLLHIFVAFTY